MSFKSRLRSASFDSFESFSYRRWSAVAFSLALIGAAALHTGDARAQALTDSAVPDASASAPAPAASAAVPAAAPPAAAPRYSAAEVAQMFGYIDRNKDGFISREEAAGFRGVARHFDEADTNKDNMLSRDEFEKAMNKVK